MYCSCSLKFKTLFFIYFFFALNINRFCSKNQATTKPNNQQLNNHLWKTLWNLSNAFCPPKVSWMEEMNNATWKWNSPIANTKKQLLILFPKESNFPRNMTILACWNQRVFSSAFNRTDTSMTIQIFSVIFIEPIPQWLYKYLKLYIF